VLYQAVGLHREPAADANPATDVVNEFVTTSDGRDEAESSNDLPQVRRERRERQDRLEATLQLDEPRVRRTGRRNISKPLPAAPITASVAVRQRGPTLSMLSRSRCLASSIASRIVARENGIR
jgi:hypothetical protein